VIRGNEMRKLFLLCALFCSGLAVASEENIQHKFELSRTSKSAAYEAAQNEVQASEIYNQANREDRDIVSKYGSYLHNWIGKIDSISAGKGDVGASVVIKSPAGVTYNTDSYIYKGNCWLCDVMVYSISTGSLVYKQLSNLKEGDSVRFSGRLIKNSWESISENGSLYAPEVLVRFDSIQLDNNETKLIPTMTKKRGKN
jgi:hypothetical protein